MSRGPVTDALPTMTIRVLPDARAASLAVADDISQSIRENPSLVLGIPTGRTPGGVFAELIRRHRARMLDFAQVTTFNLDEFVGIATDHPASFQSVTSRELLGHLNVRPERVHVPDGRAADLAAECAAYERAIAAAGGLDLLFLGLGRNGHLAFNEPGAPLDAPTRVETLSDASRAEHVSSFGTLDAVPRQAVTMGLGTILAARRAVLLALGEHKAAIVARAFEGPVSAAVPASVLQRHPGATIVLDQAAARLLRSTGAGR